MPKKYHPDGSPEVGPRIATVRHESWRDPVQPVAPPLG